MMSGAPRADLKPSVSVVVPTRQRPELLYRALVSILGQNYDGDIEVLVVFDQEEPLDPEIEVAAGRSIRLLRNERRAGLAGARNTGILAATGDYVAYCDDDDEWLPDKLRHQVQALSAVPSAEVVVTGVSIVYDDRVIDRVPATDVVDLDQLLRSRTQEVHPSSILARREAYLDGIGLVDEAIPGSYGEDYEWLLRASRREPILVVRKPLIRAYWHRTSFFSDRWATIVEAIEYLLAKYPEFQGQPRGLARLYGRLAFAHAAMGHRSLARRWARESIRLHPKERRAYLALCVSSGLVSPDRLLRMAHRTGKGI
jgi:glycosyltransferase involved in cell wall biosynthesis